MIPHRRRVLARLCAAVLATFLTACSGFDFFVANAPVPFGSFRRATDIAYAEDARQRLDVFYPKTGLHPVVIFFYGGSWSMGRKSDYAFVGAALAAHGYVTVIPDYRLYPQVRFPQFISDAAQATAWIRQHAQDFGGDPNRIVLMGHSAGAHMAALLALDGAYLTKVKVPPSSIVGLIGLSGPYALVPNTDALNTIFSDPYTPADWQPVRFANPQAPPTLLLQGSADTVVSAVESQQLRDALQADGVAVESHFYPHRGHADTIASISLAARFRTPALRQTLAFLDRVTASSASPRQGTAAQN